MRSAADWHLLNIPAHVCCRAQAVTTALLSCDRPSNVFPDFWGCTSAVLSSQPMTTWCCGHYDMVRTCVSFPKHNARPDRNALSSAHKASKSGRSPNDYSPSGGDPRFKILQTLSRT